MSEQQTIILFTLFPGVTQLDFTGPHQVFSRLPNTTVLMASRAGGDITTDGITFAGLAKLADIPECSVLCVPGGAGATENAIHDEAGPQPPRPRRNTLAVELAGNAVEA